MLDVKTKKIAKNLSFSPSLLPEHDRLAKPEGDRGKWVVVNAAMLALLDLAEEERQELMGRARSANDNSEKWEMLLNMATESELLKAIRRELKETERFRANKGGDVEGIVLRSGNAKINPRKPRHPH